MWVFTSRVIIVSFPQDLGPLAEILAGFELPVPAGFEATGNRHRPLAHRLPTADIDLPLISSLARAHKGNHQESERRWQRAWGQVLAATTRAPSSTEREQERPSLERVG